MLESVPAALVVLACAVMLLRLGLGERRRWRFDAAWRHAWAVVSKAVQRAWHWRASRAAARRAAEEALRRARDGVHRDGNVIRPTSFRGPRKPH